MTEHQIRVWFQNKRQNEKANRIRTMKSLKEKNEILELFSQSTSSTPGPNEIETGYAVETFNDLSKTLLSASSHNTNHQPLSTSLSSTWTNNSQNKSEMATTLVRSPSVPGSTACEPSSGWIETEEYDFFRDFA